MLGNVRWRHRIIDWEDFRLIGFINHCPDFLGMVKSGGFVLIEYKGNDRNSSDERKGKPIRKWADKAGDKYRYFMVFKKREFGNAGAYTLDRFMEILREL